MHCLKACSAIMDISNLFVIAVDLELTGDVPPPVGGYSRAGSSLAETRVGGSDIPMHFH